MDVSRLPDKPAGRQEIDTRAVALSQIGSAAADCLARAVARAVWFAEPVGSIPAYRS